VKVLVDNQLPAALARFLEAKGIDAIHVSAVGLEQAEDRDVWQFATSQQRAVVSKDEDFVHLAVRPGSTGLLIWVRLGNCRKLALLAVFESLLPKILDAAAQGQRVIEIR
jgi:predicted nuclease of predicted toxin-antitoxin system